MSYDPNTVELRRDANRYSNALIAADRHDEIEQSVRQEIKEAFHLWGVVAAERIALPCVDARRDTEGAVTLKAAVLELIQDGQCDDELMALLTSGSGELVDNLRTKLRDTYIQNHASDVAGCRT